MLTIVGVTPHVTHTDTRIPFRYGIAEMTRAPHAVIDLAVTDGTRTARGLASEQLPPKWFTKDPGTDFARDLDVMVDAVLHASTAAVGLTAADAFTLWQQLDLVQREWADSHAVPGLLNGLGTALIERALIDAVCRLIDQPFVEALRTGALGVRTEAIHPELHDFRFSPRPSARLQVRHTVGLGDPLTDSEVENAPDDLPVSLEASIRYYGLTHLKIKTRGDVDEDVERLRRILAIAHEAGAAPRFTIDGNESMSAPDEFRDWWGALSADPLLSAALEHDLIAVEQPFARAIALDDTIRPALRSGVPVIIDESDGDVDSLRRAMDLGYAGGTYKGCKGVFRGIANAALVEARSATGPTRFTAEDLSTLPPLTVTQDLVVAAALGMTHIERNGHHYFGRLAQLAPDVDDVARAAHPDLFENARGATRLRIRDGGVTLRSALAAPFGFHPLLDVSSLPALSRKSAAEGMG